VDYLERALRIEERPVLLKDADDRKTREKEEDEKEFRWLCDDRKKAYDADMAEKQRLARMTNHFNAFKARVLAKRKEKFDVLKAEQDDRFRIRDSKREEDQRLKEQEEEEEVKMADQRKREAEAEYEEKEKKRDKKEENNKKKKKKN